MTNIKLTNAQFAQLQIDNLTSKDLPCIQSWSAEDVQTFNAILNDVDFADEFTFDMKNWTRQRIQHGTGAMIEINEMNADKLYQLYSCYLSELPKVVYESLKEVS